MTIAREPSMETLLAWWCDELPADESREVEERIFTDDAWAHAAQDLANLRTLVREATREGLTAVTSVTASTVRQLEADGVRMRHYVVDPGGVCPCQASHDRFYMVHLKADLRDVARVDVGLDTSDGLSLEMEDVIADRASGQVVLIWPGEAIRAQPDRILQLTLYAVDDAGRHSIGEYKLIHSSQLAD